jgi:hypothetical protein
MFKALFVALSMIGIAMAQNAASPSGSGKETPAAQAQAAPAAKPSPDRQVKALPVIPNEPKAEAVNPASFPPTTPVITLAGFCPKQESTKGKATVPASKPADCKTVITKAEFEKITNALNPKMPGQAKQSFATDYSKMLVLSELAHKRGLESTEHYKEFIQFAKMQVLAQELLRTMQDKAKPSDAEVQKYYQDNEKKYEEISLKRVFIPRNSPNAKPDDKKPTDDELKSEGEKVRERLSGEADFDAVQKEVYTSHGYQTPPPPTTIPDWRRESVPPSQMALFDLKQGELSPVMVEPAGAYIYRVEEKKAIPLDTVKVEIESQLGNQRFRQEVDSITASVKPELNEAYFKSVGAVPGEAPMGSVGPMRGRPMMVPRPGTSRATVNTTPSAAPQTKQ